MLDDRTDDTVKVVVAALTFRRPDDLAALLPTLAEQAERSTDDVSVLIVDNDPDAGARGQVEAFGRGVRYLHAATPGIAAARNAALDAADEADLLVFIDDDERPVANWLALLLATWRASRPAAVVGPVVSEYAVQPDSWVLAGRFFDRRRLTTGTTTSIAATNNLLLDLSAVRRAGLRFDERFGLTGGSDTLFTRALHASGGRLVWCDEAVVTDVVPPNRVTREWVLQRAYRSGNSDALTSLALTRGPLPRLALRARLVARGGIRVAGGGASMVAGRLLGRLPLQARGRRTVARGAGMLAGTAGTAYVEYKRD
ncbi:MAG: succinoglycan biosynthesis protein ExoM [Microbacteriaceae bacterium]|nr:succinoglycan biosynthesis protein ExoM [Microbacteriaceae bacterium]